MGIYRSCHRHFQRLDRNGHSYPHFRSISRIKLEPLPTSLWSSRHCRAFMDTVAWVKRRKRNCNIGRSSARNFAICHACGISDLGSVFSHLAVCFTCFDCGCCKFPYSASHFLFIDEFIPVNLCHQLSAGCFAHLQPHG